MWRGPGGGQVIRSRWGEWGVFGLLVIYTGLISVVQFEVGGGLVRWAGYSVLTPLVAGALLSFWRTLTIGLLALFAALAVYGFMLDGISPGGRAVVITVVLLAFGISLVVCRVRLDREERLRRLTISRARLALLSDAGARVGSTLNVSRTAQELAEVAVPQFGDFVAVDLLEADFHADDPAPGPLTDPVVIRRVARTSVLDGWPEAALELGETGTYEESAPAARTLVTGLSVRARAAAESDLARPLAPGPLPPRPGNEEGSGGLHSVLTVPLRARGTTLGVAVFVRHQRREPFDDDDLILAEEIATRAAMCIDNARRYTRERVTALTLQRSLLPQRLPQHETVEVASRYLPAAQAGVGGDWFDVIPLSGARVALVVGDVVGHGIQASATMGRLRTAVRTLADIDLRPDELLTRLDDLVIRLSEETADTSGNDIGATCLYAVYDPVSCRCTLAHASHLAPVVVRPDGRAGFAELPAGPPLGLGGLPFESTEVELPEGSLIALYTDGLVESRERDIDEGLDALRREVAEPAASLEDLCDNVVKALLPYRANDDVALLLARTRALGAGQVVTWDLPPDPTVVATAREQVSRQLTDWGLEDMAFTVELVVSELVTNSIRHAAAPIRLRLIRDRVLTCEVSDSSSASPHLRLASASDEGGRGLFLVARLTGRWGSRQIPGGKTVWAECALGGV
jgi:serine phosphatase RsbU (regulator of sigma subunit)/anti-sigma regulatory factor (Ser/Thr protein kinase)